MTVSTHVTNLDLTIHCDTMELEPSRASKKVLNTQQFNVSDGGSHFVQ